MTQWMKVNPNPLRVLKPSRKLYINFYIERKSLMQKRSLSMTNGEMLLTKNLQKFLQIHRKHIRHLSTIDVLSVWNKLINWQLTPRDQ